MPFQTIKEKDGNTEGRIDKFMQKLTDLEFAYIAGFIDADGSINVQIVARKDYILKYQLRVSITIFQKTSRHWVVLWFHKKLKYGTVRKRPDGMSEYTIVGNQSVQTLLIVLLPFLKVKRRQALLILEILKHLSKKQDPQSFLKLCEQADKIALLNDSKNRTITASVVRETFLKENFQFPVETEILQE
jgi:LAGLIDADG endonuclease